MTADGWIDFASLPGSMQVRTVELVASSSDARSEVLAENAWVRRSLGMTR